MSFEERNGVVFTELPLVLSMDCHSTFWTEKYTFILWEPHFIPFQLSSFWTSNPLSNILTGWFLLFWTNPTYFILIPWLLMELTRFHYLRS